MLILAYLIRAIGDIGNETLSWFSPLGIVLSAEVYVYNYWSPILLVGLLAILLLVIAFFLNSIRDLGAGFLSSKLQAKFSTSLFTQGPISLALRVERTGLIAWAIGILVLGASYGSVLGDWGSLFKDVDTYGCSY